MPPVRSYYDKSGDGTMFSIFGEALSTESRRVLYRMSRRLPCYIFFKFRIDLKKYFSLVSYHFKNW